MKEGIEMKEGADMTAERGTRDGVVRAVREQKAIAIIQIEAFPKPTIALSIGTS